MKNRKKLKNKKLLVKIWLGLSCLTLGAAGLTIWYLHLIGTEAKVLSIGATCSTCFINSVQLQPTPTPIYSNSTVCSDINNPACSYYSSCGGYAPNTYCEHVYSCNGSTSTNNLYQCLSGNWVYIRVTSTGACNFCGGIAPLVTPTLTPTPTNTPYPTPTNTPVPTSPPTTNSPSCASIGGNLVANCSFENSGFPSPWVYHTQLGGAGAIVQDSTVHTNGAFSANLIITSGGTVDYGSQLYQPNLPVAAGHAYKVQFDALSSSPRNITVANQQISNLNILSYNTFFLGPSFSTYSYTFVSSVTDSNIWLEFNVGLNTSGVHIDNVSMVDTGAVSLPTNTPIPTPTQLPIPPTQNILPTALPTVIPTTINIALSPSIIVNYLSPTPTIISPSITLPLLNPPSSPANTQGGGNIFQNALQIIQGIPNIFQGNSNNQPGQTSIPNVTQIPGQTNSDQNNLLYQESQYAPTGFDFNFVHTPNVFKTIQSPLPSIVNIIFSINDQIRNFFTGIFQNGIKSVLQK